jgi:hypothetical protein
MTREGKKRSGKVKGRKAPVASEQDGWAAPFPKPAQPEQRYSPDTPWLAIVNARGAKGVWRHDKNDPSWVPLCLDLFTHPAWSSWRIECQMFTHILWRFAAKHDVNGMIWGEPEMLRRQIRSMDGERTAATVRAICDDRNLFAEFLELHAQAGLICYLSDAEKEKAERLIFAKQNRQDRTGQDSKEQNSTPAGNSTGSGVIAYAQANPDCSEPTGQESESTGHDQGRGTAAGQSPHSGGQPVNPQKPEEGGGQTVSVNKQKLEVGGASSGTCPAGPRIDASPHPTNRPFKGEIAGRPPRRGQPRGESGEPSLLGDVAMLRYNDSLNLAFGCQMHNETHKGACLYPGTRQQRDAWPRDTWSDVTAWINLFVEHIRGRADEIERVQSCLRYAGEQRNRKRPPNNLAAATRSIINKSLGLGTRPKRAGPA